MFHVEQILTTIAISGILFSAMAPAESAQNTVPTFSFALSTDNQESKRATQNALLDLLLGWDESADRYFQEAVSHDANNALAYAGLCLTNPQNTEQSSKRFLNILLPNFCHMKRSILKPCSNSPRNIMI